MRLPRGAVPKPSIRLRLTLWYGALFLLAGTVLLALNFALVARNFPSDGADLRETIEHRLELEPGELRGEFFFVVQRSQAPASPPGVRRGVPATPLFNSVISHIKTDTLQQIVWQSGIALALMAVLSVGLGWFVAGRMLRPVHEIAATARRISEASLEERIALGGPSDELKDLADQFDAMLDRLQSAFEAQREFVANASHELRTPLTIIRTEIDVTLDDPDAGREQLASTAEVVRRAITRTEGLIDRLLVLARAEEPLQRAEESDLADAVRAPSTPARRRSTNSACASRSTSARRASRATRCCSTGSRATSSTTPSNITSATAGSKSPARRTRRRRRCVSPTAAR